MTPWPHGDPRDVARAIVADPRFLRPVPVRAARRSWIDDVRDWFVHGLRAIFARVDHVLGANNGWKTTIGFVVIGLGVALLGYGVYLLVRSLTRTPRRRAAAQPSAGSPPVRQSAALLRGQALAAGAAGRYRDAATLLFLAAVSALDELGRTPYDPARTPGEYRRLVDDPAFDALAADAVVALFAPAEPRADLFERMNAAYERFLPPARG